nr:annexin B11-like [Leptinotarsa decemlineata]
MDVVRLYYRPLEEDIRGDTSGTLKRMLVSLCTANRDESMTTNPHEAQADAQALLTAGELRLGNDIEDAIKREFSGNSESGFLAIIRAIKNQPAYFAKQIHNSISGMGTEDKNLIRLIVTRSEIDMGDIKRAYESKYGETLREALRGDASGDYKKCLLGLIGE